MSAESYIKSIIKAQGPISIAQYMGIALSDKKYGYYTTKQPLGRQGDFITAPEISQMFGELIGLWCASIWEFMGRPVNLQLVEFGPGKGTLMSDLLRGTSKISGFHDSISIHLIEISPSLKKQQQVNLNNYDVKIEWYNNFSDILNNPTIIIGNEFFDALPILQFVKTKNGWREKLIGIDASEELKFMLSPAETPACALIPQNIRNSDENSVFEICPSAISTIRNISQHLKENGGAALFIDYGYFENPLVNSFQAVKEHEYHDVLKDPGQADLTAHVDFSTLKNSATESGITTHKIIGQGQFLQAMGIDIRASMILKNATFEQKKDIISATERLTDNKQMGELFKCLAITHPELPAPPGFESEDLFEIR
jgi:NADH dehydrogenase [ubiquinone] 1 alpha subcomplex assembly factor 7